MSSFLLLDLEMEGDDDDNAVIPECSVTCDYCSIYLGIVPCSSECYQVLFNIDSGGNVNIRFPFIDPNPVPDVRSFDSLL